MFTENFVRIVFSIDIEGDQVSLTKQQQEIFNEIKNNPEISRKDLALLPEDGEFYNWVNIGSRPL